MEQRTVYHRHAIQIEILVAKEVRIVGVVVGVGVIGVIVAACAAAI